MADPIAILLITAVAFLLAGFVKGVIGLGLPTIAVGLLGLVMKPAEAAAILIVPSLVTNIWQIAGGPSIQPLLKRLWPMLIGVCIGTWAGGNLLTGNASHYATTALGIVLVLYAGLGLIAIRFHISPRSERLLSPLIGAATGLVTSATGVFVVPAVPYLQALGLEKDDLVQALGISFTVSTLALATVLAKDGTQHMSMAGSSLAALLPALAGMGGGQWVRSRVSAALFRRYFFVGLSILGAHLALRNML
ncbi:MAG TPA: sulfite exporter TauE/SafE family protein [Xanthobacteraceae bacterium]|jgi:hypothetical protein|nr:sulfite exporter TauE/SafE family protein [Xanthobacteraceae bacterium]